MSDATRGEVRIRSATAADRSWVVDLSARLHEFGPPPWRPVERMDGAVAASLRAAVDAPSRDDEVLVAEDSRRGPLGFVHVHTATDFFTAEVHTHISDLAVHAAAEGRGVAKALVRAAERWAADRGHRLVTLNVFAGNERARAVYARLGYAPDTIKLVKELDPTDGDTA